MRFANDDASKRLYTEFLSRHERCNFQQSVEWAQVKSNWKNEIILAEAPDGTITGGMSVLIRRMPLFGNLMYCPRGPICRPDDAVSLRQLTEGAQLLAWKYNAMALRMEPDVSSDDGAFRRIMKCLGWQIRAGSGAGDMVQPRHVFRLDIRDRSEEELMAGFGRKLRYNIRLAQRRGVEIRRGGREDLAVFHALLVETARRDGFLARPLEYLRRMWDALGPEHMELLLACYEGRPIAGAIPVYYGNKTWYVFGASGNDHRDLMPNYLLQWEIIRTAAARGCAIYDMRGVLERADVSNGLYLFKSRFGGVLTEFIGEVTMPYKPMTYRLYRTAERAYMAARDRYTTWRRRRKESGAEPPLTQPRPLPWHVPGGDADAPASA